MEKRQHTTESDLASEGKIIRWSAIHQRARDLGFPSLGDYLCTRYILERKRVEEMAEECLVTPNTLRKHLKFYGLELGTPREPLPTNKKGRYLVCTKCGRKKYYAPSQMKKLDSSTYRCRECLNAAFADARAAKEELNGQSPETLPLRRRTHGGLDEDVSEDP